MRVIPPFSRQRVERFWAKVDKTPGLGPHGTCWHWTGATVGGYGSMGWNENRKVRSHLAHRISYFLEHGEQPGPVVMHTCDNPRCVNPAHLINSTQAANIADRESKGRGGGDKRRGKRNGRHTKPECTCRGSRWQALRTPEIREQTRQSLLRYYQEHPGAHQGANSPRAKLCDDDVREIRRAYAANEASSPQLAARFKVSKQNILAILHRRIWDHVE